MCLGFPYHEIRDLRAKAFDDQARALNEDAPPWERLLLSMLKDHSRPQDGMLPDEAEHLW
jgi:hypothetical protein